MKPNRKKCLFRAFSVILLVTILLLPAKKVSYAQNTPPDSSIPEIIVVFKNKPTVSTLAALSANVSQNLEIKNSIAGSNSMVFTVTSGDLNTAIAEVTKDTNVKAAFPNYQLNLFAVPNDPMAVSTSPQQQWNLYKLNLAGTGRSAWDVTTGSPDITVAIIDTGINSTHPEFSGKIASLVDCSSGSCSTVTSMTDNHAAGHGTHVAGMVGAATNNGAGIASTGYKTKLMIIKVMAADGSTSTDSFFNGIKWAADHNADVINTSFGIVADSLSVVALEEYNGTVEYAWERGAVVVAAAGNCGGNTQGSPACAIHPDGDPNNIAGYAKNSKIYPAASPNVISVAATTVNNSIASYSEHNDASDADIGNWISVAAPGGDGTCSDSAKTCILSTVPGNQYFWQSGTSMAAPQVAGVAALVLAANPSLTNEEVKDIIESTGNKSVAAGSTNFGLVDALAAVVAAAGNTSTNLSPTPSPSPTRSGPTVPPNSTPTVTIAPTSVASPTIAPTAIPTVTPYPTVPPRLPKQAPNPYPAAPFCPNNSGCLLKTAGDANCDGKIDESDWAVWNKEFDSMVSASPANLNANFLCVEGNSQTYFVDMVDFEVWRKNTSGGL